MPEALRWSDDGRYAPWGAVFALMLCSALPFQLAPFGVRGVVDGGEGRG